MAGVLLGALTFISYVGVLLGVLFYVSYEPQNGYMAELRDKQKLLKNTPGPKLVLVGGSNLAFGVDSEKIEQQTGMRVVNMGLHGGVGLPYMLSLALPELKSGDVVVVSPEYELFFQSAMLESALADAIHVQP